MRAAGFSFFLFALTAAFAACDSAVKVGEPKSEPDAGPPGPIVPAAEAAAPTPAIFSWRQHAPVIPCTIYALDERASNDVFIGCNGGRVYRFDGVKARLDLEVEDTAIVSLLWHAKNGTEAFAAAQSDPDPTKQTTQLHRFDGTKWTKFGDATKRIVSLAGIDDLWVATETEILKREGDALVSKYQTTAGSFRACTFAASDNGWCVGTNGLAVAWDGATWAPLPSTGIPWTVDAEVFGVEWDSFAKVPTFFYGEPISQSDGDHSCRFGRIGATFAAKIPCFPDFRIPRKRTGVAFVAGANHYLLSVDASYGGAYAFHSKTDTVTKLCAPVLAFATGSANTRAGGLYGLLATIVGAGDTELGLSSFGGVESSSLDIQELSVAPDGTAWARLEDAAACATISDRIVRFEDGQWKLVAGPQGALSGRSLAAVSKDRAYTIDQFTDRLLIAAADGWTDGPVLDDPWSLFAAKEGDVWVGGRLDNFGHADEKTYTSLRPVGKQRQAEQILTVGGDTWIMQLGTGVGDTHQHLLRWDGKNLTDEDLGISTLWRVRLGAVPGDPSHVYRSGRFSAAWTGTKWKDLDFEASGVWARSPEEVYFIDRGDIWKWDGATRTRVYHGMIPIHTIDGSKDRGFAVGPGGLTLEFAAWPDEQR